MGRVRAAVAPRDLAGEMAPLVDKDAIRREVVAEHRELLYGGEEGAELLSRTYDNAVRRAERAARRAPVTSDYS